MIYGENNHPPICVDMGEIYAFEHIHCRVIKHISVNVRGIILAH